MGVPVTLYLGGILTPVSAWPHPTKMRPPVGVRLGTVADTTGVFARDILVAGAVILANYSLSDMVGVSKEKQASTKAPTKV